MIRSKVKPSLTLALLQRVREMRAAGVDVASFAAGEPDFPTPVEVVDAAIASMRGGNTKYVATSGIPALRKVAAEDYAKRLGVSWARPENILATAGGKEGIYLALAGLLQPGDEVLIPKPYWVSYPDVVVAASGKSVFVETQADQGFFPRVEDLDRALTPRTRALIFSSPSNPTGTMIAPKLLQQIVEWCVKNKVVLLFDEIYERLILDGSKHYCPLMYVDENGADYVISINAFSKTMSMTGWRLGYLVTSRGNVDGLSPLQGQMMTCLPGFIQDAAVAGFACVDKFLPGFVEKYKQRLELTLKGLAQIPGVKVLRPSGAFYVFVDVSTVMKQKGIATDYEFAEKLLEQEKTAVVAGTSMGSPGWVRLSFATSEAELSEGLARLKRFCA